MKVITINNRDYDLTPIDKYPEQEELVGNYYECAMFLALTDDGLGYIFSIFNPNHTGYVYNSDKTKVWSFNPR